MFIEGIISSDNFLDGHGKGMCLITAANNNEVMSCRSSTSLGVLHESQSRYSPVLSGVLTKTIS